jgi:hypothetical protein
MRSTLDDFITHNRFIPKNPDKAPSGIFMFETMKEIIQEHRSTHVVPIGDVYLDCIKYHGEWYDDVGTYEGTPLYCRRNAE